MKERTNLSRRQALKMGAGAAVGAAACCVGLTSVGCAPSQSAAAKTSVAASASSEEAVVGTRYTKASNVDEIGIVHDAQNEEDADVVVVGSGMAGMTCAMIVAEQDPQAKVIVVEARGICGGGANYAEQPDMPAKGTDWIAAAQYGDETAANSHFVKDGRLIAERSYDMGRNSAWMFTKHGVPLTIKNFEKLKTTLDAFEAGQPITRWNGIAGYEGGNGSLTIQRFINEIDSDETYANVEIRTNTRAIALLSEDEYNVSGIQVLSSKNAYTNINAKAVVLACGGMSNNLELLQNYSNQDLQHCVSVDQGHFGDGMVMVEHTAHGRCKTITLSSMQGYVDGMDYQSWLCLAVGGAPTCLFVNQEGARFANEDMSRITDSPDLGVINYSKLVEGQGAVYSIMGSGLLEYYKQNKLGDAMSFYGDGQDERPFDLDADLKEYADNENVFVADSIEELAQQIGVPKETLVETVATYDADAAAGEDSAFMKNPEHMVAMGDGPFYAFKMSSIIVNTNAGVRVDHDCRVVDQDFTPVAGLYAAGVAISGFVSDVYETGNCQCVSIWSGSKAARSLVEQRLDGTVADDWFGPAEWDEGKDLPAFANQDEYDQYLASL